MFKIETMEIKLQEFKEGVDVKDLRKKFPVVAALIATITFAAPFTIPGGFNEINGSPVLIDTVALQIFILCDSLALSLSLVSLMLLIGSPLQAYFLHMFVVRKNDNDIVKNIEERLALRAILYLCFSLHATRLAFVSGIYVVVAHKCQWLAVTVGIITFTIPLVDFIWSCSLVWLIKMGFTGALETTIVARPYRDFPPQPQSSDSPPSQWSDSPPPPQWRDSPPPCQYSDSPPPCSCM